MLQSQIDLFAGVKLSDLPPLGSTHSIHLWVVAERNYRVELVRVTAANEVVVAFNGIEVRGKLYRNGQNEVFAELANAITVNFGKILVIT
ncbi:MAG TPA: hypothetical protein VLI92_02385 [Candidatus Saccharimonadales bacterium]|nr:hypothetical protein [Candidatus Saccharimonadales bacterium]